MTYAWREQYLDVNLTTGHLSAKPISRELLIQVIGGIGLAAQLVYENVHTDSEPLSEHNVLVFAAGPLSGTTWAGTGRLVVAGRSPLTGIWGEASIGGYFATQLKRCGYDAILVRGMAPEPVALVLQEALAELRPAADLWGLDTYQTEDRLQLLYPDSEVISIGPAGEHLVPMASLVHHRGNDIAARCGLGAIAGSKRLKAIVASGNQAVPVADPQLFNQLKKESIHLFNRHDFIQVIRRGGGTASAVPIAIEMADMTARNWDIAARDWKEGDAQQLSGPAIHAQFPPSKDTCYACPVACKWSIEISGAGADREHLAGPEYETITGLGSQVQISDPIEVMRAGDLCNRLGMDTISAGATIAWALEVHEKGLLPNRYIDDDLPLSWNNAPMMRELLLRIAENRPRLGALLALGSRRASSIIGAGQEIAIQVKGLELPFHHPRALRGLEIAYATLPRGASHNEEGVAWDWKESTYESWVKESIHHMNLSGANSSMVYCQFLAGALNIEYTARLLTAITGVAYTPADLIRSGERTWYLRRLFNLRLGVGAEEDTLPKRIIEQIKASSASLKDFDVMIKEFYRQRELDVYGMPARRKLDELGLGSIIAHRDDFRPGSDN
jgi:aldehyde:ferredoxin oxidoreductase